jgi:CDP-glucose 4,6-dehydratase
MTAEREEFMARDDFFWEKRPCLVTGGAGFGGSHLCSELVARRAKVHVYDRSLSNSSYLNFNELADKVEYYQGDIKDLEYLKTILSRLDIDTVFHLAAQPIKPKSNDIPYETFYVNALGTYNVLEAVRTSKQKPSLVFASTGGYYGTFFSENLIPEDSHPVVGDNIYSASKVAGDIAVRYYSKIYGIRAATCRFMQTYGPGDTQFSRIIPITVKYLMNRQTPKISRCDGTPQWDFMHVRDMARAYIAVAEKIDEVSGEAFNFGGGNPISVKDLVILITKIFTGELIEPIILMKPSGVLQKTCLDISKAEQLLGWRPQIRLEDGLKETIEWYRSMWEKL